MKRFKFRLDSVIRYRRYLEKMALMALAKVTMDIVQRKKNIQDMERTKETTIQKWTELMSVGLSVQKHRFYEAYIQGLEDKIQEEQIRLEGLEAEKKEKHSAVESQRKKKKILEAMRRQARAKHMKEAYLSEQKEADEMANLRSRIPRF